MQLKLKNSFNLADLSLFLLSFTIGSVPIVASVSLGLFCFFNIRFGFLKRKEISKRKFYNFWPIWGILVIYVACLIYSPNITYGLKLISRSLIFIIIPIVFWYRGGVSEKIYCKTTMFFVLGVAVSCLISILISLINYLGSQNLEVFTYYELAETINLHPTYFSIFILTALLFLHNQKSFQITLKILLSIILITTLVLLQSRVALIGLICVFLYSLFASKSKNYRRGIIFFSVVIVIIGFLSNDIKGRFSELVSYNPSIDTLGTFSENGINQRAWLWKSALLQVEKQPIIGYGLGSQRNLFQWQVEKMLIESEFNSELLIAAKKLSENNLHNQYLQILYECGYLGLILFFALLVFQGYRLLKNKKYQEFVVLLILTIFLVTENLIARQMGIYFYGFIFTLFLSTSEAIE